MMGATHTSISTTASKKQTMMEKNDSADQVLDIMQRAEAKGQTMKQPFKPQLNPIVGKGGTAVPRIGGAKVKTTATGSG